MPGTLTFKLADLKEIAEHAIAAKEFSAAPDVLHDPAVHHGGKVKTKDGWPDASSIDRSKLRPALVLVKGDGVGLMSNGLPRLLKAEGSAAPKVVYAKGLNPEVDAIEVLKSKTARIMGDDYCEITLTRLPEKVIEALHRGLTKLQIRVNKSSLSWKCL